MEFPPERYRRNVGISRFNFTGKIFAASWLNRQEILEMPQDANSRKPAYAQVMKDFGMDSCSYWKSEGKILESEPSHICPAIKGLKCANMRW
ncbi:hypothetical protein SDJN02_09331 [Cucurbita argyrosperma subsp. argyrosperma]|nr:hypothetical protein SDJN02_09331 [Cucurbita argyrosperma subsp. argyrosperma]